MAQVVRGGGKQDFEKRAHLSAVKMLAEETHHRPNVTQAGLITDGPPYRVGPIDKKIVHREPGNPESLRAAREELRWNGSEHQKIVFVHYHDRQEASASQRRITTFEC